MASYKISNCKHFLTLPLIKGILTELARKDISRILQNKTSLMLF